IALEEIVEIRPAAAGVLARLVKREILAVERKEVDRKSVAYYTTTERFLKLFKLNSLDDLPIISDVDYR
ncbi:MAG: SMC-Scp complex subunit ScpB, partial [Thermoguttaceae bacterium]|nr:SMC-Scp complex subunit ScpB [Thermoguttaceae bacterium]